VGTSSHFPPFGVVLQLFCVAAAGSFRLNPYVIQLDLESEWRYKGVLKGFSYAISRGPLLFSQRIRPPCGLSNDPGLPSLSAFFSS
jgi:hypothetical protein